MRRCDHGLFSPEQRDRGSSGCMALNCMRRIAKGGLAKTALAVLLCAALVGGLVSGASAWGRSRGAAVRVGGQRDGIAAAGHAVPAGAQAHSFSFVSSQTAFVLGQSPCGKKQCTVLLRTENRGSGPAPVCVTPGGVAGSSPASPITLFAGDSQEGDRVRTDCAAAMPCCVPRPLRPIACRAFRPR